MNRREMLTAGALAAMVTPFAAHGGRPSGSQALLDQLGRKWVAGGVPAVSAGYAHRGRVTVGGYGFADLENRVRATPDTAYRYASLQKSMTAVAVMQLVEAGRIDLDADIRRYVSYYPAKRWTITPRQLLNHLGGVPHYVNRVLEQHFTDHKTTRQAIAVFADFDLVAEPGTKFVYSSYGYNLLGAAIEEVSGQAYADYMTQHLWRPAGMNATRMDDPAVLIPHRSRGYRLIDGALRNSEFIDVSSRFAAGGTRGTVPDLLRFMTALEGGRLLSRSRVAEVYVTGRTHDGGFSGFPRTLGYAMGWNVIAGPTGPIYHNDGGQQETRTMMLNIPSEQLYIATAQNFEEDGAGLPLVALIYEAVTGRRFPLSG